MKSAASILPLLTVLLLSCTKEPVTSSGPDPWAGNIPKSASNPPPPKSILVDASKDGGVWWYPQSSATGFSPTLPHQGLALAEYFRNLGYRVDELARGEVITSQLLDKYTKVIRASAFFSYSTEEIKAYTSFLNKSSSLLLVTDHLQNATNDQLSASLGLVFEGVYWGPIASIQSHAITSGVTSVPFNAGSVLRSWDPSKITALGYLTQPGNELSGAAAMGIVNHPSSRIFFIGDLNGIEQVPQPFVSNLETWLFQ